MKKGFIYHICLLFIFLFFLASIIITYNIFKTNFSPTYSLNKIDVHLKEICKKDYEIEIDAKLKENTLIIDLHNNQILSKNKELTNDSIKNLQLILKTIGRIIQSIEKKPEFYIIQFFNCKNSLKYRITGSINDIIHFHSGGIKRSEYAVRRIHEFNPDKIIKQKINLIQFVQKLIYVNIENTFLKLSKFFKLNSINIKYDKINKELLINFDIKPKQKTTKHLIFNQIKKISFNFIKKYKFKEIDKITIFDKFENLKETTLYKDLI